MSDKKVSKTQPTFRNKKLSDPSEASKIYILPNLLTAGNLFFGFLAIIRCIQAKYTTNDALSHDYYLHAVWFIFLAFLCDALDGRIARISGKESLFGKEFDSIADIVSFGVAPALMVFFLILSPTDAYPFFQQLGWIISFIYLLCAGVRLARFNVITHPLILRLHLRLHKKQTDSKNNLTYFKGLPVPAAAGMIASLVLVVTSYNLKAWNIILPFLMLLIAGLMVSSIPYPSFKNINWRTRAPVKTFISVIILAIILFIFREISISLLFLSYIFYGLFASFKKIIRSKNKPVLQAQVDASAPVSQKKP